MGNIIDYFKKNKDVTFEKEDFNELDAMIFARFSYIDFKNFVSERKYGNIKFIEVINNIFLEDGHEKRFRNKNDLELLDLVRSSLRYKDIYLRNFIDIKLKENTKQFAAVTFFNKDKNNRFLIVSFKGTDGTVTGWKEDFNMAYLEKIPSQEESFKYLDKALKFTRFKRVYVVGHSKGGNLAIYSSSMLNKKKSSLIKYIYAFDSPGFNDDFYANSNFYPIKNKIKFYAPVCSVIGRLLKGNYDVNIVDSSKQVLYQHDVYNWKIDGKSLVKLDKFNFLSNKIQSYASDRINALNGEEKKEFVDELFKIVENFSKDDVIMMDKGVTNFFLKIKKVVKESDDKTRNIFEKFFKNKSKNKEVKELEKVDFEVLDENDYYKDDDSNYKKLTHK